MFAYALLLLKHLLLFCYVFVLTLKQPDVQVKRDKNGGEEGKIEEDGMQRWKGREGGGGVNVGLLQSDSSALHFSWNKLTPTATNTHTHAHKHKHAGYQGM